jgi:hypothetical protein
MTIAIVVILLLVALGIVSSQLFRLRDWLKRPPPPGAFSDDNHSDDSP